MKLIHIKMQNIIAKKKHIRLLSIQMPSGQITTTTVRCCNDTFVAIRPVSAASTTFSQMQCYFHFRFCHVFNSCLSMHQILIEKKLFDSLWIFLHSWKQLYWTVFIQVPKLSLCGILWRCSIKGKNKKQKTSTAGIHQKRLLHRNSLYHSLQCHSMTFPTQKEPYSVLVNNWGQLDGRTDGHELL